MTKGHKLFIGLAIAAAGTFTALGMASASGSFSAWDAGAASAWEAGAAPAWDVASLSTWDAAANLRAWDAGATVTYEAGATPATAMDAGRLSQPVQH